MRNRDTQFAGFAKLLLGELMTKYDHLPLGTWGPAEKDERIIARRAYDLVHYTLDCLPISTPDALPDMTAFPDEEKPTEEEQVL